jgi:hypothetical protein
VFEEVQELRRGPRIADPAQRPQRQPKQGLPFGIAVDLVDDLEERLHALGSRLQGGGFEDGHLLVNREAEDLVPTADHQADRIDLAGQPQTPDGPGLAALGTIPRFGIRVHGGRVERLDRLRRADEPQGVGAQIVGPLSPLVELVRQVGHGLLAELRERLGRVDRHVHADVAVGGGSQVTVKDLFHRASDPFLRDQLVGHGVARRRGWGILPRYGRREGEQDGGREPSPS